MNPISRIREQSAQSLQGLLGSRLAASLAHPHAVDRYLEVIDPMWSIHEVKARIEAVEHRSADSVTLRLRPNRNWRGFAAGQFVQLSVEVDGVRRTRCYSPANAAQERGLIELSIKAHDWGYVSRHLFEHARPGMVLGLSQAQGDFQLPEQRPQRLLLISGGSGITPVMAMLRTLLAEAHAGRISFLHYAHSAQDVIYADELDAIAYDHPQVQILRVYTRQARGGDDHGLFSAAQLARLVPDYASAQSYLCGPPGLMQAVESLYAEQDLAGQLHLERFTPAAAPLPRPDETGGEVRFARSETFAANDGRSLLEQAEAAGLSPQHGCRMGICSTCSCRKTAGTVRNLLTGELSAQPDENIRICVSAPIGDVTLDI